MSGTSFGADLLIEGAIVITVDPDRRIFSDGAVANGGGRILTVGKRSEVSSSYQATRRIRGKGKVVIPGLVNCHSHFFPFVRGAISEGHSADIVRKDYLFPLLGDLSEEEEIAGAKARMWEMICTGTTCFSDGGCKHLHHVAQAEMTAMRNAAAKLWNAGFEGLHALCVLRTLPDLLWSCSLRRDGQGRHRGIFK